MFVVIDVGHERLDRDLRVDLAQLVGRGDGLGQLGGDVVFVEQHLPLQVVQSPENRDRRCRRCPTPLRASVLAITEPSAPQPHDQRAGGQQRRCPSSPNGA